MHSSTHDLLTTAQVADIAGVDRSTVTRWVGADKLTPAIRTPGGALLFARADVERLAAERATVR
jgi:excisionase family DNA binding protein